MAAWIHTHHISICMYMNYSCIKYSVCGTETKLLGSGINDVDVDINEEISGKVIV